MKRTVWLLGLALVACKSNKESSESVASTRAPVTASAALAPNDVVYAASAHLRIVDAAAGRVVKNVDFQHAVSTIVFSRDAGRAYLAASDGVREVDTRTQELTGKLTEHPARNVEMSEDGARLYVLEHQVIVNPDETREILPFHLVTIDVAKRTVVSDEEIGQRVLYAYPPIGDRYGVVVLEKGDVRKIAPRQPLSSEGTLIDPLLGQVSKFGARVREGSCVHGGKAYLPIEAEGSRILEIDLASGEAAPIMLGQPMSLRGLAFSPDGGTMYVDAGKTLLSIDMKSKRVAGTLELGGAHTGVSISTDGRFAYLAQTIDGTGGAVTVVSLDPFQKAKSIHLDDISPWALAVRP